jgi:hypothetical protein
MYFILKFDTKANICKKAFLTIVSLVGLLLRCILREMSSVNVKNGKTLHKETEKTIS